MLYILYVHHVFNIIMYFFIQLTLVSATVPFTKSYNRARLTSCQSAFKDLRIILCNVLWPMCNDLLSLNHSTQDWLPPLILATLRHPLFLSSWISFWPSQQHIQLTVVLTSSATDTSCHLWVTSEHDMLKKSWHSLAVKMPVVGKKEFPHSDGKTTSRLIHAFVHINSFRNWKLLFRFNI